MTGAEHFEASEALIEQAQHYGISDARRNALLAEAQVHATLALAAASVIRTSGGAVSTANYDEWRLILSGGAR